MAPRVWAIVSALAVVLASLVPVADAAPYRVCANAGFPVLSGNVSLDNGDQFAFRETTTLALNLPFWGGMGFQNSFAASGSTIDVVSNRVISALNTPPTVSLAVLNLLNCCRLFAVLSHC